MDYKENKKQLIDEIKYQRSKGKTDKNPEFWKARLKYIEFEYNALSYVIHREHPEFNKMGAFEEYITSGLKDGMKNE